MKLAPSPYNISITVDGTRFKVNWWNWKL